MINGSQNPISIVTQEFDDIEFAVVFGNDYNITMLPDALSWKKFLEWFYTIVKVKPISMLKVQTGRRIVVINTDIIIRIPADKTEKAKKKKTSVYNFVRYIFNHSPIKIIFLTEKPLKKYKMQVPPTVIGTVHEFNNPYFIADVVLHEPDRVKALEYLNKYKNLLDPVITIIQHYFNKYEPDRASLDKFICMYYSMRFEVKPVDVRKFIIRFFKSKTKRKLSVGRLRLYGFKSNDLSIIRSI